MAAVAMTVNGKAVTGDIDPRTLLEKPAALRRTRWRRWPEDISMRAV